ncbi:MAG: extracellular solute-binding protein [Spirochaetia bacterium]|nr:extracellular solute-binding protein [Spirochaetia bacterium]
MHKFSKLFIISLVAFTSVFLTGCKKDSDQSGKLYLYNWTYYTPEHLVKKFEKETGIDVIIDNFASNEEMFAKVMAGGNKGYDIIFPSSDYTSIMIKLDKVEKLDHSLLPNLKYVNPLIKVKASYDPDMEYSVPYFMGTSGIAVNKEKAPADYARNWSIFADTRMSGRMSMLDDMREVMAAGLKHLGYSANSTNDEELRQATELIITEWKPNLVKFDSESFGKAFSQGEFWVSHSYPENIFAEIPKKKWKDIDFFIPEEGGMMYIDNMVIPKGVKNSEAAHAFINFMHDPKNHAEFLDEFGFPPTTNTAAAKYMESDSHFFSTEDMENSDNLDDLGSDLEKYNQLWQLIRYVP